MAKAAKITKHPIALRSYWHPKTRRAIRRSMAQSNRCLKLSMTNPSLRKGVARG